VKFAVKFTSRISAHARYDFSVITAICSMSYSEPSI
jgi:hypothetical protein